VTQVEEIEQMEEISTFQATTVTATSISSLLNSFLRSSSASLHRKQEVETVIAQKRPSFPQKIYRIRSEFQPRIKLTLSRPMCIKRSIRCTVWPATMN
jgi:hypothetical protein